MRLLLALTAVVLVACGGSEGNGGLLAGGSWKISLDAPVAAGHEWSDGIREYRWESKGSITTPAGTFKDCWSATTVASYTSYIHLCRGVGPVKWHYEDGFGNGYEAVMTAKNF